MDHSIFSADSLRTKLWNLRRRFNFTPIFVVSLILWLLLIPAFLNSYGEFSSSYFPIYNFSGRNETFGIKDIFVLFSIVSAMVGLYMSLLRRRHICACILWSLYTVFYHFAILWPDLSIIFDNYLSIKEYPHASSIIETIWLQTEKNLLPPVVTSCLISLFLFWLFYIIASLCIKHYAAKLGAETSDTDEQSPLLLGSRIQYLPLLLNLVFLLPIAFTLVLITIRNADLESGLFNEIDGIMGMVFLGVFCIVLPVCASIYCRKSPAKMYLQMKVSSYACIFCSSVLLLIIILLLGNFSFFDLGTLTVYLVFSALSIPLFCCFASYRAGKLKLLSATPSPFPPYTKTIIPSFIALSGVAAFILLASRLLFIEYKEYKFLLSSSCSAVNIIYPWLIVTSMPLAAIYATWCFFKAPKPLRAMLCTFSIIPVSILGCLIYNSFEITNSTLSVTAPVLFSYMTLAFLVCIWLFFGFYSLGQWTAKRRLKKQASTET